MQMLLHRQPRCEAALHLGVGIDGTGNTVRRPARMRYAAVHLKLHLHVRTLHRKQHNQHVMTVMYPANKLASNMVNMVACNQRLVG